VARWRTKGFASGSRIVGMEVGVFGLIVFQFSKLSVVLSNKRAFLGGLLRGSEYQTPQDDENRTLRILRVNGQQTSFKGRTQKRFVENES